jgi:RND family efflux transporter MFP subunit
VDKNAFERTDKRFWGAAAALLVLALAAGCSSKQAAPAGPAMHAMPVQTVAVKLAPVAQSSDYVSTIKARNSATLMPRVDGNLTDILVRSGDMVQPGQPLMRIDSSQQQATVASQQATEQQKKALYDYNVAELARQKQLFEAGVTSRQAFEQEQQAYQNAKSDYESAVASRKAQAHLLDFYTIRAPFAGVVGDVPVHVGDYVTTSTMLTTVDERQNIEAYIYIPTERAGDVRMGLPVDLLDSAGNLLESTKIDFVSPQVDPTLQAILAKAPVHSSPQILRNAQMVTARVIWATKPMPVVPVLAVTRQGSQSFVFVAQQQQGQFIAHEMPVTLGGTVGNNYSISSGLSTGDKVIVSGTQFLVNNMPVMPLGG